MRYPTRNGLIISPYELGYTMPEDDRRVTRHHGYFTREAYRGERYQEVFRNLVTNVFAMLPHEHNVGKDTLHARYKAPAKPSDTLMVETVQDYLDEHGVIRCVKENKTFVEYEIQEPEWVCIKGLYRSRHAA